MYRLLAVASDIARLGPGPIEVLGGQVEYLCRHGIDAQILLDPGLSELESRLRQSPPDCVYMLPMRHPLETDEDDRLVAYHMLLTRLLQHLRLGFIGQDFQSQLTLDDKTLVAHLGGLNPPGWLLTRDTFEHYPDCIQRLQIPASAFPVIVKPNNLWASKGINRDSICSNANKVFERARVLFQRFERISDIRVEVYLARAREFTVSVIGNGNALLVGVTALEHDDADHIVFSEDEKTAPLEVRRIRYKPFGMREPEYQALVDAGKQLFQRLGFRDVARFDLLMQEQVHLIDANHMPSLGRAFLTPWQADYGLSLDQLLAMVLVAHQVRRCGSPESARLLPDSLLRSLPSALVDPFRCNDPQG